MLYVCCINSFIMLFHSDFKIFDQPLFMVNFFFFGGARLVKYAPAVFQSTGNEQLSVLLWSFMEMLHPWSDLIGVESPHCIWQHLRISSLHPCHILWRVTNTRCAFLLWRQNNNETNFKLLYIMFVLCSYTCWSLGNTKNLFLMFLISYPKQLVCLTGPLQMGTITFTSHWIRVQQLCHPFSHLLMLAKGPTQGHNQ